jgi:hypothetical protein
MTLTAASPVNIGSYRLVRLGDAVSNGLKIRCQEDEVGREPVRAFIGRHSRKTDALSLHHCYPTNAEKDSEQRLRESIKSPISVPLSPSSAVECYPCRQVSLNYSDSHLFHGGNTGSILVLTRHYFDYPKCSLSRGGNMGQEHARIGRNMIMQVPLPATATRTKID